MEASRFPSDAAGVVRDERRWTPRLGAMARPGHAGRRVDRCRCENERIVPVRWGLHRGLRRSLRHSPPPAATCEPRAAYMSGRGRRFLRELQRRATAPRASKCFCRPTTSLRYRSTVATARPFPLSPRSLFCILLLALQHTPCPTHKPLTLWHTREHSAQAHARVMDAFCGTGGWSAGAIAAVARVHDDGGTLSTTRPCKDVTDM